MTYRTDRNNNPTAFTVDVARTGGLILDTEYSQGESFNGGITAKILGDPIAITIKLIDNASFYTQHGNIRWIYIAIPQFIWLSLSASDKKRVIKFMYQHEGGTELMPLFNA